MPRRILLHTVDMDLIHERLAPGPYTDFKMRRYYNRIVKQAKQTHRPFSEAKTYEHIVNQLKRYHLKHPWDRSKPTCCYSEKTKRWVKITKYGGGGLYTARKQGYYLNTATNTLEPLSPPARMEIMVAVRAQQKSNGTPTGPHHTITNSMAKLPDHLIKEILIFL